MRPMAKFRVFFNALAVCAATACPLVWQGSIPALAQVTDAAVRHKGSVLYRVPDGWKEAAKDGSTLLIPGDVSDSRKCVILLLPGQEFTGDLKPAFEKLLESAAGSGEKILQAGELQVVTLPAAPGVSAYQKTLIMEDKDGNKTVRAFVAAHPGKKRIELAVIVVYNDDALKHYQDGIKAFLASWSFANVGGKPALGSGYGSGGGGGDLSATPESRTRSPEPRFPEPKAKPGELAGLFFGQHMESSFNGFSGSVQYGLVRRWYYFLPGGRVYYGLPQEGISAFNWQQHLRKEPDNCGLYHFDAGKIVIAWQGGSKPWQMAFSRKGNVLNIGGNFLEQMVTPVGAHFSGTYGLTTYSAVGGGGVGGEHKLVLSRDGQFQETGFVGFTVSGPEADATGRSSSGGRGTYRVTAEGLELTYSDGKMRRAPFQVQASQAKNAAPEFIMLNGVLWLKR